MTAGDLREFGIVDGIVPEPAAGAARDPDKAAALLRDALLDALDGLDRMSPRKRRRARERRYRDIGRDFIVAVPWSALSTRESKPRLHVPDRLRLPLPRRATRPAPAAIDA